jgi:hypothetical protein
MVYLQEAGTILFPISKGANEDRLLEQTEVGWGKQTPESGKIERRRCQNESGSVRKVNEGVSRRSGETSNGRESILTGGSPPVVVTTIDARQLGAYKAGKPKPEEECINLSKVNMVRGEQ